MVTKSYIGQLRSSLAKKITIWILAISGVFTLFISAFQLYMDFRSGKNDIQKILSIVEVSHIDSLKQSVWSFDDIGISTKLDEMINLPNIAHVNLNVYSESIGRGDLPDPKFQINREYSLKYVPSGERKQVDIGRITVTASLEGVYKTLKGKIFIIVISQTIKTFFVSFFILFLVYSLITRHLERISRYLTHIDLEALSDPLTLDKGHDVLSLGKKDELDLMVSEINSMQTELRKSVKRLHQVNQELNNEIVVRKKAEEELIKSEARFRNLFENSPVSLWEEDFSFVKSYLQDLGDDVKDNYDQYLLDHPEVVARCAELVRIIDLNQATLELHGATSKDELLENLTGTFTPESYKAFQKEIVAILEGSHQIEIDTVVQTLSGIPIYVCLRWQVAPGYEKNLSRILISLIDITERKKAEAELTTINARLEALVEERTRESEASAAEARAANRAKSDFLARMSHEIRTPMNGIIGLTDLLLKSELTSQQKNYMKKVSQASGHLLNIINDLLDFSKIEAGRLEIAHSDFMLNHVIGKVAEIIGEKSAQKEIELFYIIDKMVPLFIIGDPLRLNQILINLMSNAVKFTEKGQIILKVEMGETRITDTSSLNSISPDGTGEPVELLFSVQDTGIGISSEFIDTLFHPFTQADGSVTRKHGGTGLGLSICRQLVTMMGGQIWVDSLPGKGSTFFFTLPFDRQPKENPYLLEAPHGMRNLKVLVADDNEIARIILKDILSAFDNFQVTVTGSGPEALDELKSALPDTPYDLLVVDWRMPDMDGFEVARKIRKDPIFAVKSAIPRIIMVTMYGREEVFQRIKATNTEIDGFVFKPVSSSTMFNAIMKAFGREDAIVPAHGSNTREIDTTFLEKIQGARILLVEDNEINQEVTSTLLERAGLMADIANNGLDAVEMLRSGIDRGSPGYDAVLMDIEMPEMDGYEATRIIRSSSQFDDLPVIAMTAHALKGDREKCMDAGMNDYLTKPVNEQQLFTVLFKWIKPNKKKRAKTIPHLQTNRQEMPPGFPHELPGINLKAAVNRLSCSENSIRRMLNNFSEQYESAADDIRKFMDEGRFLDAQRVVHSVKGISGNLCAEELYTASKNLEEVIKQEEIEKILPLLESFKAQLAIVIDSLKSLEPKILTAVPTVEEKKRDADPNQIGQVLTEMVSLLKKKRAHGWKLLELLLSHIPDAGFHEEKIGLEKAMNRLDTQAALSLLSTLAEKLNISIKGVGE